VLWIDAMWKLGLTALTMYYYDIREDQLLFQLCDQSNSYCEILSTKLQPSTEPRWC
jgi:hypothetical protein